MKESLRKAYRWLDEGRVHLSPAEAGELLHVDGQSLASAAKDGQIGIEFIRTGRNIRISLAGVIRFLQGGYDPMKQSDRIRWEEEMEGGENDEI